MSTDTFAWRVERFAHFDGRLFVQGWAFHQHLKFRRIFVRLADGTLLSFDSYGLPSDDVEAVHGSNAAACRFKGSVEVLKAEDAMGATLVLEERRGRSETIENPTEELGADAFHQLFPRFIKLVGDLERPTIVEIGARSRSGNLYGGWWPEGSRYVGFDVVAGLNVDVVGDAHSLSEHFGPDSIDVLFGVSTVEHLAMPWQVVGQINRILRSDGLVFFSSHQTWPVHDAPWDFWRFSQSTWRALLNEDTGFEIIDSAVGDKASIVSNYLSTATQYLDLHPAFLGSSVIARKTKSVLLDWPVDPNLAAEGGYPA